MYHKNVTYLFAVKEIDNMITFRKPNKDKKRIKFFTSILVRKDTEVHV